MTAAIRLSASERWLGATAPMGRASRTMALVAVASLFGHMAVIGTLAVSAREAPVPPTEIAVEIVQEVPKPAPAPEAAKPASAVETAKPPEPVKAVAAKPDPEKPVVAKSEPPAPARPAPKAERKKIAVAPPPPPAHEEAAKEHKLAALQQELENLRAEQARLQADRAAAEAEQRQAPAGFRDTGLGPLPDSFQAVALPAVGDGAAEAVSYEEIVFSALAKAKGIGRRQGLPGTAGVRFSLDASGKLVDVELVAPSGIAALDSEALDVVRRASPFPPPPQGAQRSFAANVNFVTDGAR